MRQVPSINLTTIEDYGVIFRRCCCASPGLSANACDVLGELAMLQGSETCYNPRKDTDGSVAS